MKKGSVWCSRGNFVPKFNAGIKEDTEVVIEIDGKSRAALVVIQTKSACKS